MNMRPRRHRLLGLLPKTLVRMRTARHGDARYLTFDDGPDPAHTPLLLDLLARHGVRASFFLIGEKIERHPELVERIVREGHTIGNHSYSHWMFKNMSLDRQLTEIRRTDRLLQRFDRRKHLIRPPHGYVGGPLLMHFVTRGRHFAYWSYDSLDYQEQHGDALVQRLRKDPPQAGEIVLLHDDNDRARHALDVLLPEWLAAGHTFRALEVDG